ncbi:MAG: RNA polymerase sigma factor [Opitutaceae bacterium]
MSTPPQTEHATWFAENVHPHEPQLRSWLRGSFPAMRDVDDIVQESYLRIWKVRLAVPVRSSKTFLFRIARHIAIDLVRRDKASPLDAVPDVAALGVCSDRPGAAEEACTQEELALLAEAVLSLPPRCREIVLLQKIDGLRAKEIAARLGIAEDSVHAHLLRGVHRCEAFLRRRQTLP